MSADPTTPSLPALIAQARAAGHEIRFAKRSRGLFEAALYRPGRSTPIRAYSSLSQALALEEALLKAMPDVEREAALRARFPESEPLPLHCEDHDYNCKRCEEDDVTGRVTLLCSCGDDAILAEPTTDEHASDVVCFECAHRHLMGDWKCAASRDGRRCAFDENHRGPCNFADGLDTCAAVC